MARIRTIKPEFWSHEELSELPEATHLLAAALLNHADDEGYFKANPRLVMAACSPLREPSVSVHDSLNQLARIGYISLHAGSDGKSYGRIVEFAKHQRVNRPSPSKIKGLVDLTADSVNPHGAITEGSPTERNREQGTGNREQGREKPRKASSTSATRGDMGCPDDVAEGVWTDWLALRRKLKAPVTATALDGLRREGIKAGKSLEEVLAVCCQNGWRGFNAAWGQPDRGIAPRPESKQMQGLRALMGGSHGSELVSDSDQQRTFEGVLTEPRRLTGR